MTLGPGYQNNTENEDGVRGDVLLPAPPSGGGILQVGYDALASGGNTLLATGGLFLPLRDALGRIITVELGNEVQLSSYLRVQWNLSAELSVTPGGIFGCVPRITFDGISFFWIISASGTFRINAVDTTAMMGGLAVFPVPGDVVEATDTSVQLYYNATSDVIMPGWLDPPASSAGQVSLEVQELDGTLITQAGPAGALTPV